jgi:phage FluMu protein Com
VPELIELRCTCKDRHGKHPLLAKAGGGSFVVEIKCRACKKLKTFQHPHPLSPKK